MSRLGGSGFDFLRQGTAQASELVSRSIESFLRSQQIRSQQEAERRRRLEEERQRKKAEEKAKKQQALSLGITAAAIPIAAGIGAGLAAAAVPAETAAATGVSAGATVVPTVTEETAIAAANAPAALQGATVSAASGGVANTASGLSVSAPGTLAAANTPASLAAVQQGAIPGGTGATLAGAGRFAAGSGSRGGGGGVNPSFEDSIQGKIARFNARTTGGSLFKQPGPLSLEPGARTSGIPNSLSLRSNTGVPGTGGPVTVRPGEDFIRSGPTQGPRPFTSARNPDPNPNTVATDNRQTLFPSRTQSLTNTPKFKAAGFGRDVTGQTFGQRFLGNTLLGASSLIPGVAPILQNISALNPQLRIAEQGLVERRFNADRNFELNRAQFGLAQENAEANDFFREGNLAERQEANRIARERLEQLQTGGGAKTKGKSGGVTFPSLVSLFTSGGLSPEDFTRISKENFNLDLTLEKKGGLTPSAIVSLRELGIPQVQLDSITERFLKEAGVPSVRELQGIEGPDSLPNRVEFSLRSNDPEGALATTMAHLREGKDEGIARQVLESMGVPPEQIEALIEKARKDRQFNLKQQRGF